MDLAGYCVIAAVIIFASLLWQLNVDFYRPWCERRVAAEIEQRRDHEMWIKSLQQMNDEFRANVIPAMRVLRDSMVTSQEAMHGLASALRSIGNAASRSYDQD